MVEQGVQTSLPFGFRELRARRGDPEFLSGRSLEDRGAGPGPADDRNGTREEALGLDEFPEEMAGVPAGRVNGDRLAAERLDDP